MKKPLLFRRGQVARLRSRILHRGFPRLFMLLLISMTACIGFLVSALLLRAGWQDMGWRYLLACCVAYLCFLSMLWIWLKLMRVKASADALPDLPLDLAGNVRFSGYGTSGDAAAFSGKGGSFDGGGASADVDFPVSQGLMPADAGGSSDGLGSILPDADVGELGAPIVLVVAVAVLAAACGAMLYATFNLLSAAPLMFAELIFDGLLAAGMYRRYRYKVNRSWLETAFQHTWRPFLGVLLFVCGMGFILTFLWPQARTLGDVLHILFS